MVELRPFKLKNGGESDVVFLLCTKEKSPFELFLEETGDRASAEKMATAIEMLDRTGVTASFNCGRLRILRGCKNDLCEIKITNGTARGYSFVLGNRRAVAIAFIEPKTHSGTGKKGTKRAIDKLESMRCLLNEALGNGGVNV